ncbi:coiled-coil domain-containing protein 181 [Solea solea]|uniref:coiled-coil domain-containing protein 181 n=1 Tax=Solea solea TaxID=90069 RepID=UPI00272ACFC7|nr:coiled-coil domain-containing protein 181 [Solea solea]
MRNVVKRVVCLYDDGFLKPFSAAEGPEADYVLRCCSADCVDCEKQSYEETVTRQTCLHVFFYRFDSTQPLHRRQLLDMSEVVCTKSQEEYEDDFEKDLDWLIDEEGQNGGQSPKYNDTEVDIDKALEEEEEKLQVIKQKEKHYKDEKKGKKMEELEEEEERWPPPMEPLEYDSDRDSSPSTDDQTDEEKKYILEKIQQANRELQDQETPDITRRRRLHFKETLVDLVVPPLQFEKDVNNVEAEGGKENKDRLMDSEAETVSGKLSELRLSPQEGDAGSGAANRTGQSSDGGQEMKEGRVLVEKDGKFDLVSLKELESQGLLPAITNNHSDHSHFSPLSFAKINNSSSSIRSSAGSSTIKSVDHLRTPRPPAQPRNRPSSANHSQRGSQRRGSQRRVHSATGTPYQATYTLSPQQKELLLRIQERKEKLAREAEERKREEDEQRRQDNELAFRAWLMRKREQLQEERRILRAQEMERISSKRDCAHSDSEEAFRLWLQRKQEQRQKEQQLLELKKLEEDSGFLLHSRQESERAFKLWVKRKRAEKRAEQQAAREHSRRLVLEERRARRMRDLQCTVTENKPFRFGELQAHHF